MLQSQRLRTLGLCLALGVLLSACDPKPPAPKASAGTTGASPTGITPAESGDKVESTTSHNGPSEGGRVLHNPRYDFNDELLPIGASYWARLAESCLA